MFILLCLGKPSEEVPAKPQVASCPPAKPASPKRKSVSKGVGTDAFRSPVFESVYLPQTQDQSRKYPFLAGDELPPPPEPSVENTDSNSDLAQELARDARKLTRSLHGL
eukprot:m.95398 g.95398  ORF g.95398 m.95398 type:complete len:109 (+) comp21921_c0_seq1:1753-2079(+)